MQRYLKMFVLISAVGCCHALCFAPSTVVAAVPPGDVDPDDAELDEQAEKAERRDPASKFDQLVFRREAGDAELASRRLETLLQRRIDAVSRGFRLSESQARALELAGRGDIRRLLERVDTARRRMRGLPWDARTVQKLNAEAAPLQRVLVAGPFADDSLFGKMMPKVLTKEQFAIYTAVQRVEGAGGRIRFRQDRANEPIEVYLTGTSIEDDSLEPLGSLTDLEILRLQTTRVTNLESLSGLKKLRILDLTSSWVTASGLAHLQKLPGLEVINLGGTRIRSADLVHLSGLPKLRKIDLERTDVGDEGIGHLRGLKELEILNLGLTRVTDAGLVEFGRQDHPRLAQVSVCYTNISDAGLESLKRLGGLKWLDFGGTSVTDEGVAALKRALPELKIHR